MGSIELNESKGGDAVADVRTFEVEAADSVAAEKLGTRIDQRDMYRVAKLQQLRGSFSGLLNAIATGTH